MPCLTSSELLWYKLHVSLNHLLINKTPGENAIYQILMPLTRATKLYSSSEQNFAFSDILLCLTYIRGPIWKTGRGSSECIIKWHNKGKKQRLWLHIHAVLTNLLPCPRLYGSKILKIWTSKKLAAVFLPKIWSVWFYHAFMCPKDADRMANSVDPDKTAPSGAVLSGSTLFAHTCLSEYLGSLGYIPWSGSRNAVEQGMVVCQVLQVLVSLSSYTRHRHLGL